MKQFVFTKKAPFMQRISDLVRTGHTRYVQGQIPQEKALFLAQKFDGLYQTGLDRLQQSRKRKGGDASARLLMWQQYEGDPIHFILLTSHGKLPAESREKWRDATDKRERVAIEGGYELVRITKPLEPKPVWTWKYTKSREDSIRESIIHEIRVRHDHDLDRMIFSLWQSPGFAGIRDQVKKFKQLILSEWKRSRAASEPPPAIPERIGYVQRLQDKGYFLGAKRKKSSPLAPKEIPDEIRVKLGLPLQPTIVSILP